MNFAIKGHTQHPAVATAELSDLDLSEVLKDFGYESSTRTVFFSRLFVPSGFTPKTASILLMQKVVLWADNQEVIIIDEINPYGKASIDDIIALNLLYGFKRTSQPKIMIRFPKVR